MYRQITYTGETVSAYLRHRAEHQSARMSKITNYDNPVWQQ